VDAASGGFLAPFVEPELEWDFRLPRVKSINTSGHKFGLAPLGVGWVIWRDKEDLADLLIEDLKSCIAFFEKNPVVNKISEEESGGFKST